MTTLHYDHLIIGGGMTADAAARGIRETDPNATIGLISAESDPPYNRPPLSKGLWKGDAIESIWRRTADAGVDLHLARTVTHLDAVAKQATDDHGTIYAFDRLLLATGGTPRRLAHAPNDVIYFRSLDDYRRLKALAGAPNRFAVIGGGFIGSEVAAALRMQGGDVTMLVPEEGVGARVFPADLSRSVTEYFRERGVEVRTGERVENVAHAGARTVITTASGATIDADAVVAGLGIEPNAALALQAGLEVSNGIVVDEFLRTRHPDIFAAGDVASVFNATLDARMRLEHEDSANAMGAQAGRNMAGEPVAYGHLPFFYSDLFDLGYEAVGDVDARLRTVADWKTPFREGVVYYLRDGRVRGVLLWNVWGQVDAARQLIAEPGPFTAQNLEGRIAV